MVQAFGLEVGGYWPADGEVGLADAAGLDPGYLSQLENRKRAGPVATIKKLAAALRLDLDDLT